MGLFSKLKQKVGEKVEEFKENQEKSNKLHEWQGKFERAKSAYDLSIMDERELLYVGTRELDQNVNKNKTPQKKANNVVNIIYELIESQIDTTIPQPSVSSKIQGYDYQAQVIEDSIKNDLLESDIYRINDENERTTPIQGESFIIVNWNPDFNHHLYRGEIELDNKHPKCIIPQPGIFNVQKMDYFFVMASESKEFAKKRYNADFENESEAYPEINTLDEQDNPDQDSSKVTIITAYYKDKDGEVGKYTWCNDKELEDLPRLYCRRLHRCTKCNSIVQKGETCQCGNKKSKESIEEYEELTQDIIRADGTVIPAMSPVMDEMGQPQMQPLTDQLGQPMIDEMGQPMTQPVMEPTKIKYFCPKRYPIVMRKNVPVSFNFGGQSDVDSIRDQADAIKKVVTKIEKKIIDGTSIIKLPKNKDVKITDEIYKVVRGELPDLQSIGVMDLQADISADLLFVQEQYRSAQYTLGITDTFQGKPDQTAKSGVAKQIQVNQASGRMQSKTFNKRTSFKELYEIIFEFKLAFYDDTRPYMKMGIDGKPEYGVFNKYDFLEQDAAGEWYYNTDFLFFADAGDGLPKDKLWLMTEVKEAAAAQLLDKVQYWQMMEKLGFPGASDIKKQAEEEKMMMMQQQAMMQEQQMMMQQQQTEQQNADREFDQTMQTAQFFGGRKDAKEKRK